MQALYFEWSNTQKLQEVLPILEEIYAWEDWIKTRFSMIVEDLPALASNG